MSAPRRTGRPDMADADLEQLSAWLDGELDPEQNRAMLDRLKKDPDLRAQYEWFNLAGDALRSHEVAACHQPRLVIQVREALKLEPVRIGPGAGSGAKVRRHVATALTIAAAAGMLVVVAVPQLRNNAVPTASPGAGASQPASLASAVTPSVGKPRAKSPQLDAYFRAHREMADTGTGVMPSAVAYMRMSGEPDR
jgi:sigma-E factor negative regulatory protein RseA